MAGKNWVGTEKVFDKSQQAKNKISFQTSKNWLSYAKSLIVPKFNMLLYNWAVYSTRWVMSSTLAS